MKDEVKTKPGSTAHGLSLSPSAGIVRSFSVWDKGIS
jgi:hypothetical protein